MFERYTEVARKAVFFARYEASVCSSPEIETEHLLLGILREGTELAQRLLLSPTKIQAIREKIRKQYPAGRKVSTSVDLPMSVGSKRALAYAAEEAQRLGHNHIGPEHLLLGLSREKSGTVPAILRENAITCAQLKIDAMLAEIPREGSKPEPLPPSDVRDMTQVALEGKLGPLIGRKGELERVVHILSRRTKNNCVLIGEAGVGKTAIVQGLALRMAEAQVPAPLVEKRLIAMDASSFVVARQRTRSERWLDDVLTSSSNNVLFVRGLFNLAVGGSAWPLVEAMHVLEPHLASGRVQCIATGSASGLRETVEKAATLARHFEIVEVAPVNEDEAIQIVSSLIPQFERFHEVTFATGVIEKAVYTSGLVLPGRHLPDRAIDLIDEAAVTVRMRREIEPREMAAVRNKIRLLLRTMENAIVDHEFEKARQLSDEERKERDNLERLREQYKLPDASKSIVTPEDIEAAVAARAVVPIAAVQTLLQQKDAGELHRIIAQLSAEVPPEAREWVPFLAAYLVRCSPAEVQRLTQAIASAKPK